MMWLHMDDMPSTLKDGREVVLLCEEGECGDMAIACWSASRNEWQSMSDGKRVIESQGDFGTEHGIIFPVAWAHRPRKAML